VGGGRTVAYELMMGGVIEIDFFSFDDLDLIAEQVKLLQINKKGLSVGEKLHNAASAMGLIQTIAVTTPLTVAVGEPNEHDLLVTSDTVDTQETMLDDRSPEEAKQDDNTFDEDLYNIKNFTI
jgi:hypothetical protein